MKTVLIFIGLKLAEIAGVVLALWLLSVLGFFVMDIFGTSPRSGSFVSQYIMAMLHGILTILLPIFILGLMYGWFHANWEKAKQIGGKW